MKWYDWIFLSLFVVAVLLLPLIPALGADGYKWEPADNGAFGLRLNGIQIGAWIDGLYRPFDAASGSWGAACEPPCAAPVAEKKAESCDCCGGCNCGDDCRCGQGKPCCPECRCLLAQAADKTTKNYGLIEEHIGKSGERYTFGGQTVHKRRALEAIRGGGEKIPDDRKTPHLLFNGGSDADRAKAVAAAQKLGLSSSTLIKDYPADSPILKPGFVARADKVTTQLQSPDGKVLAYSVGADQATLAAVREEAANNDPAKYPDPANPLSSLGSAVKFYSNAIKSKLASVPGWAWIGGGILLVLYLRQKGKV